VGERKGGVKDETMGDVIQSTHPQLQYWFGII
jgi:hypothetical protein